MSTLAQLRTSVRNRIDVTTNDTGLTNTVLTEIVNTALKHVALRADWEWLDAEVTGTLTAGSNTISAPSALGRVQFLVLTDTGEIIDRVARSELARIATSINGRPERWAFDGSGGIEVRPIPSSAQPYALRYYKTETVLSADGDTPLIPTAYDDGVVEYAAYLAFRYLHRPEEAGAARAAFDDWFKNARDDQTRARGTFRVKVRPGGWL